MISRDCQKFFLNLLYEYGSSESRLDNSREILWSRITRPAYYIDIFKVFLTKKSQRGEENWSMDLDDLKILLEDLEIKFKWEELKPLCGLISKSWSRETITFIDFLNFFLPDVESVEFIKRRLTDLYREELSQTIVNFKSSKEMKIEDKNQKNDEDDGYKFDLNTFEITIDEEEEHSNKEKNINLPLLNNGRKNKKFEGTKHSLNTLKRSIFNPIKQLFQDELENFRYLKMKSRLVSSESSFNRRKLFHMIDFENNGVVSFTNLKQFTIKHAKPIKFKTLKLVYRRMKLNLQEKVTFKEFVKIFFDCYNTQEFKERHYYNFYYKREGERRLKLHPSGKEFVDTGERWITGFNYTKGKVVKGKLIEGEFYKDTIKRYPIIGKTPEKKKSKSVMWSSSRTYGGTKKIKKVVKMNKVNKRTKSIDPSNLKRTRAYSVISNHSLSINSLESIQIADLVKKNPKNSSSIVNRSSHQNSVLKNLNLRISPMKKAKFKIGILSRTRRNVMNMKECLKRLAVYFKYLSTSEAKISDLRELMAIHYSEILRTALHFLFGKGDRLSLFSIQKGLAEKLNIVVENGDIKLMLSRVGSKVIIFLIFYRVEL